ncbi:MAG: hypothetical protein Q8L60_00640 [Gammaproteobacteria bacterium]|nr:hypothetical protein [Anaerolineales bacterium]MDP1929945.1 hypothetical protein [Gammaproteobacteria bacterium]MDP2142105.1 hypothetical protein [Gammaproteobacteria bacterium]
MSIVKNPPYGCIALILLLMTSMQSTYAQDLEAKTKLAKAFEESTKKVTISDNFEEIPQHKIYRSIFLKALLNPEFGEKFLGQDWEIIYGLPSHSDVQFTEFARETLMESCSVIESIYGKDDRSANEAGMEFESAKARIMQQLDQHYEVVLESLSEEGRKIVYAEILEKIEAGLVTYSDVNFASLGSIEPEFTVKFLRESCSNVEKAPGLNHKNVVYLRDELAEAYKVDSVQEFTPEAANQLN